MKPYRYIKAAVRPLPDPMPRKNKISITRTVSVLGLLLIITGSSILVFLIWPIVKFQFLTAPQLSSRQFVSPQALVSIRPQVLGSDVYNATSSAASIKTVSDLLPQRQGINQLRPAPFWSADLKEFSLAIPKLKIENARVLVGEEKFDDHLSQLAGSALPGEKGNMVIVGHSGLPQFFNPKNYKTIFATISDLEEGDNIIALVNGIEYRYVVESLKIVKPDDVAALFPVSDGRYLTLLTCVPPGLNTMRLLVTASMQGVK